MWNMNKEVIRVSCENAATWGGLNQNLPNTAAKLTDAQLSAIHDSTLQVSKETDVDARLIFGVILQENHGCLSIRRTNNGVSNPGLMQSHNSVDFIGNDAP
ncbi:hypothetical protein B0O99DRAFT_716798 [Bisporella sp. PMI_857]|nr:hypothetical protein B0O99DRAFT_716798 [Bisporella sp. PMI_857]